MPDAKNPTPENAAPATDAPEVRSPRPEPAHPSAQQPPAAGTDAGRTPDDTGSHHSDRRDPDMPELTIPVDTVAWIILKAREFDMKQPTDVADTDDDGDNPLGVLEDRGDDATVVELTSWISDLTETEQAELTALMWLGRGDDGPESFGEFVQEARGQKGTARYLLGEPQLGDYLEEGLAKLGIDPGEAESALT